MGWELSINGDTFVAPSREEVRGYLAQARQPEFLELWLARDDDDNDQGAMSNDQGAMSLLANGDHAWLMHLRHHDGDAGFSSRNPTYDGPPDATASFRLSNGQLDTYPLAWTVSRERALQAIEHFLVTGERVPWITWHED
jgi:hypothetical protein